MKDALIIRLIKENKITEEEAMILMQKDYVFVPNSFPINDWSIDYLH